MSFNKLDRSFSLFVYPTCVVTLLTYWLGFGEVYRDVTSNITLLMFVVVAVWLFIRPVADFIDTLVEKNFKNANNVFSVFLSILLVILASNDTNHWFSGVEGGEMLLLTILMLGYTYVVKYFITIENLPYQLKIAIPLFITLINFIAGNMITPEIDSFRIAIHSFILFGLVTIEMWSTKTNGEKELTFNEMVLIYFIFTSFTPKFFSLLT